MQSHRKSIIQHICGYNIKTSAPEGFIAMAGSHFNAFLVLLMFISFAYSATDLMFNGFQDSDNSMSLDGSAIITSNGALRLTNDTKSIMGHAFFTSPIQMLTETSTTAPRAISFSTTFVLDIITVGSGGGHGLAFVLAPNKSLPHADVGQYLGLIDKDYNGNATNHIFAIEFDTVAAPNLLDDIDSNHVGVDINSVVSNVSESAGYYANGSKKIEIKLESGQPIQAWIEYDGTSKILEATIAPFTSPKPKKPLISYSIDLVPIFTEFMYAGFSSSTGGKLASSHYIIGWAFRTNDVARSLDISKLPLPAAPSTPKGNGIRVGVVSSLATLVFVALLLLLFVYLQHRAKMSEKIEGWERDYPHRFPYKELYRATKGFKDTGILGRGGFGIVYKGKFPRTKEAVAIKKISHNSRQGVRQFVAEVASLGRLRHRNLVNLLGWCKRSHDLLLVYEFMPKGSFDMYLFGSKPVEVLSWEQRFRILKDIAMGLLYMHEEWEQVVVHRDIKSSNVLLDAEMTAKLSDFGLATLYEHGDNPHTTHVVGTVGYMAPELWRTGKATASSDVFAYGILMLEVVCGRRAIEPSTTSKHVLLMDYVREFWMNGQVLHVVDPKLDELYVREEIELVLKLGLACSQSIPEARPTMRQLLQFLDGNEQLGHDLSFVFSEADSLHLATSLAYSSTYGGVMSSTSIKREADSLHLATSLAYSSTYGGVMSSNSIKRGR